MNKKLIAIGIPCFKAHSTLPRLLSSIAIQSIADKCKIYLANDEPSDKPLYTDIIKQFPSLDIVELLTDVNGGPGVARNRCIEAATEDVITFADADDIFYTPYAVETMYRGFEPGVIQVQTIFVQEMNGFNLIPQTNINHPWVFGRMTSTKFLKQNGINFGTLRQMEDGRFEWCIRLLTEGSQLKIKHIKDVTYVWKEGSEHSITRSGMDINDGIPVYNYGLCQIGACRAAKEAIEFASSKNPFNGNIQKFCVEQMVGLYFNYYECLEKCPKFAEQNHWLAKWFYHNVYEKYCTNIPYEVLDKMYMQMLAVKGSALSKFPEKTFKQWFELISIGKFELEEIVKIRNRLPKEIVEIEKKTGTITDDVLDLFN